MGKPKLPSSSIFYLPIAVAQLSAKRKLPTLPLYPLRYLNEIPFNPFFKSFSSPSATSVALGSFLLNSGLTKGKPDSCRNRLSISKGGFVIIISFCSLCTHIAYRDSKLNLILTFACNKHLPSIGSSRIINIQSHKIGKVATSQLGEVG